MQYISGEARKPSIFVSSTCYDLKQIRRDIREFIEADLGYEAILSEYDSFPIDPDKDTINNCLRVVEQRADTSELSKSIIEDIENFIDDYHKRINELAYGLEDISGEKVVSFNLELRSPDMNKIDAEIKRLEEILLNN